VNVSPFAALSLASAKATARRSGDLRGVEHD
jgi:hypothetical protein